MNKPHRILALFFSIGLIVFVTQPFVVDAAEFKTLKGETFQGKLTSFTDTEMVVDASGATRKVPLLEMMQVTLEPASIHPPNPFTLVELSDGSQIVSNSTMIKGDMIHMDLPGGEKITAPAAKVSWVLFKAQVASDRATWSERISKKRKRDVVAILKKDADNPMGILNLLEGTLGKGSEDGKTIEFSTVGATRPIPVPQANLHGLVFLRSLDADAMPVLCKVIDKSKSEFLASKIMIEKETMKITTSAGLDITLPTTSIHKLDFSKGKLAYLSDIEPSKVILSQDEERLSAYRKDTNLDGGPIRINGVSYAKGIAMLATTDLEFDLKGEYREFKAIAGFDDLVGGIEGSVILEIEGDGKQLVKLELSRKDKKRDNTINLSIKDVQRLRIVVRSSNPLEFGKHLDLANAQINK
ncbi:MAG: NPCBM/NEW2 domain-containing protein [Gemmataceae bacterium]